MDRRGGAQGGRGSLLTSFGAALAAVFASFGAPAGAQGVEFVVISSTSDDHSPGDLLVDTITVADGDVVVVLREDGERITVTGPFEGQTGGASEAAAPFWTQLVAMIGDDSERYQLVVTRGQSVGEAAFDPVLGGDWCGTGPVSMRLPPRPFDRIVTIVREGDFVAEARWPADAEVAPWPGPATLRVGSRYAIEVDGVEIARFAAKSAVPGQEPGAHAVALYAENCRDQARAALMAE